jgi:hypothetical protein
MTRDLLLSLPVATAVFASRVVAQVARRLVAGDLRLWASLLRCGAPARRHSEASFGRVFSDRSPSALAGESLFFFQPPPSSFRAARRPSRALVFLALRGIPLASDFLAPVTRDALTRTRTPPPCPRTYVRHLRRRHRRCAGPHRPIHPRKCRPRTPRQFCH